MLVGGLEHFFYFPYVGNNSPNWPIFFRGVAQPPASMVFDLDLRYKYIKAKGEFHMNNPEMARALHRAVRDNESLAYEENLMPLASQILKVELW